MHKLSVFCAAHLENRYWNSHLRGTGGLCCSASGDELAGSVLRAAAAREHDFTSVRAATFTPCILASPSTKWLVAAGYRPGLFLWASSDNGCSWTAKNRGVQCTLRPTDSGRFSSSAWRLRFKVLVGRDYSICEPSGVREWCRCSGVLRSTGSRLVRPFAQPSTVCTAFRCGYGHRKCRMHMLFCHLSHVQLFENLFTNKHKIRRDGLVVLVAT